MVRRIKQFIDSQGISVSAFEHKISASDGMIRRAIKNNTDIQSKWISLISDNYPNINIDWLVSGRGEMLISSDPTPPEKSAAMTPSPVGIPLIPLEAFAGYGASSNTQVFEYECESYVVPAFRDAEFLISVRGSSMYPKYNSGDIVACRKVALGKFFQWNKVYVIDTEQGVMIKRVHESDRPDSIKLVSDNTQYKPFNVALNDIFSLAIVVGVIRVE